MSAARMLDDALGPPRFSRLVQALQRWADAERAVRAANDAPFEVNKKLPEIARAEREATDELLAAYEEIEL